MYGTEISKLMNIKLCLILVVVSCNMPLLPPTEKNEGQGGAADSLLKLDSLEIERAAILEENISIVKSAKEIFTSCAPSTVTIFTDNEQLGSGFFISSNLIATNYHVIDGADKVYFRTIDSDIAYRLEGFVSVNKGNDLAVLKTTEVNGSPLIISQRNITEGDPVFVIGSPKGLTATISDGIVSAKRNLFDNNLIQITAPISPGSSGGPVFNQYGEVIGVAVLQSKEGQNLNFAIPSQELNLMIEFQTKHARPFSLLKEEKGSSIVEKVPELENGIGSDPTSDKWTPEKREDLFKNCLRSFKDNENFGFTFDFCKCMTIKITDHYSPSMIESITDEEWMQLVETCVETTGGE